MKLFTLTAGIFFMMINYASAQKNLVTNGGFEDDLYSWNENGARLTPWGFQKW